MNAALRHFFETVLATKLQARRIWRPAAGIQSLDPLLLSGIEKTERVAADTDRRRFDDTEHGRRRDGRVDGVPAAHKNLHPSQRRQRLARRYHAVLRYRGKFFRH